MSKEWIIGICSSECDGIRICRFRGTEGQVKEKLVHLVLNDRSNAEDCWDHGTESIDDVEDVSGGGNHEFYGYGCYLSYHIDYTAKEFAHIPSLTARRIGNDTTDYDLVIGGVANDKVFNTVELFLPN